MKVQVGNIDARALNMDQIHIPRIRIRQILCSVHETCVRLARHLVCSGGYAQGALTLPTPYVRLLCY